MKKHETATQVALWNEYVKGETHFRLARRELFHKCGFDAGDSIVDLIRVALAKPEQKNVAIEVAEVLTIEAKMQLFEALLSHAIALETKSSVNRARQIILSLPRDWVLAKLQIVVESLILEGYPNIETGLLEICFEVNEELTRKLALKAVSNPDEYSKDIGQFYLGKLNAIS